jgi:hypothetical protein
VDDARWCLAAGAGGQDRGGEARGGMGGQVSPPRSRVGAFKTPPGPRPRRNLNGVGCVPGNKVVLVRALLAFGLAHAAPVHRQTPKISRLPTGHR